MEGAFGDFGEDPGHRIVSLLLLQLSHGENVSPIGGELSAEEKVHEENLADNIDKVEDLAEVELVGVELVVVPVGAKVLDQGFDPVGLDVGLDDGHVHVLHQHLALASLPVFPQEPGNVEKQGLEEQGETHPLVVLVVPAKRLFVSFIAAGVMKGDAYLMLHHQQVSYL